MQSNTLLGPLDRGNHFLKRPTLEDFWPAQMPALGVRPEQPPASPHNPPPAILDDLELVGHPDTPQRTARSANLQIEDREPLPPSAGVNMGGTNFKWTGKKSHRYYLRHPLTLLPEEEESFLREWLPWKHRRGKATRAQVAASLHKKVSHIHNICLDDIDRSPVSSCRGTPNRPVTSTVSTLIKGPLRFY